MFNFTLHVYVQIFHGEDWYATGVGAPPLDTQLHYNYRVELKSQVQLFSLTVKSVL